VRIDLNNLKIMISISVTRRRCSRGRGRIAERWKKVVENTSINLYCINTVIKKIAKNRRTFAPI